MTRRTFQIGFYCAILSLTLWAFVQSGHHPFWLGSSLGVASTLAHTVHAAWCEHRERRAIVRWLQQEAADADQRSRTAEMLHETGAAPIMFHQSGQREAYSRAAEAIQGQAHHTQPFWKREPCASLLARWWWP